MTSENFVDYLTNSIRDNWDNQALSNYNGKVYSYKDVGKKVMKLHTIFKALGIEKGDKVALLGKNSSHWGMIYIAVVSYGAVVVPILPDFHIDEIHHIVNHSDSKLLFVSNIIWEKISEHSMPHLLSIYNIEDFDQLHTNLDRKTEKSIQKAEIAFDKKYKKHFNKKDFIVNDISNSTIGVINYTSGTTGFSKGVVLTNNVLAANIKFARENFPLTAGEKVVSLLPLAHTFGCAFEFLFPFSKGCNIIFFMRTPSPKLIIQTFQKIKPSVVILVPLIFEKIYKNNLKNLLNKKSMKLMTSVPVVKNTVYRKIRKKLSNLFGNNFHEVIVGGAPLSLEVETFLRNIGFKYTVGYGMTECGPLISYASWSKTPFRSAGKIIDPLEVKIDSEDPYEIVGEIMVRGENVMSGYYKNEEATKRVLDSDGWFRTGDLGIIDKENNLYIRGRNKSLILSASGENIYPEEIESKINGMTYVMESLVIQDSSKLVALVYPDYETLDRDGVDLKEFDSMLEEMRKKVNEKLPKYKQVSNFKLFPHEFEKTPKKSIKRFLYNIDK